jgi:hypothetical protein
MILIQRGRVRTLQVVVAVFSKPLLPCYVLAETFKSFVASRLLASLPMVSRSATVITRPVFIRVPPARRRIARPMYTTRTCAPRCPRRLIDAQKITNVLIKTVAAVADASYAISPFHKKSNFVTAQNIRSCSIRCVALAI